MPADVVAVEEEEEGEGEEEEEEEEGKEEEGRAQVGAFCVPCHEGGVEAVSGAEGRGLHYWHDDAWWGAPQPSRDRPSRAWKLLRYCE